MSLHFSVFKRHLLSTHLMQGTGLRTLDHLNTMQTVPPSWDLRNEYENYFQQLVIF